MQLEQAGANDVDRDTHFAVWDLVQILIAWAVLIALSPLLALIAVLVKATSAGPVFYVQERVGYRGDRFMLLKFRTMHVGAENRGGPQWAVDDDPRCTRIGGLLRRLCLDELPQLVNVIRGEMNLVGPRPERPCFVEQFSREYPEYGRRHEVAVGMTGWAQIHGWRGNTSLAERLRFDLQYARRRSWRMDLYILCMTPVAVLHPGKPRSTPQFQSESRVPAPQQRSEVRLHRGAAKSS